MDSDFSNNIFWLSHNIWTSGKYLLLKLSFLTKDQALFPLLTSVSPPWIEAARLEDGAQWSLEAAHYGQLGYEVSNSSSERPKPPFWFRSDTKTETLIGRYFRPIPKPIPKPQKFRCWTVPCNLIDKNESLHAAFNLIRILNFWGSYILVGKVDDFEIRFDLLAG